MDGPSQVNDQSDGAGTRPPPTGAFRRSPGRRRHFGHRRRPPFAGPQPGPNLSHPREPRRRRRHLGPVPLSRHPLGQRHVHARIRLQALASGQGDRRRAGDPRLCPRDRRREQYPRPNPLPPPCDARLLVVGDGAVDGRGRAARHGRDGLFHLPLAPYVQRLLRLCRRLSPRFSGHGPLPGTDRPSAILARGSRLQGEEGRRHRQRRDGGDTGAGDGQGRRPRRHAAALADLYRLAPVRGQHRQLAQAPAAGDARLSAGALEERAAPAMVLPPRPKTSRAGEDPAARHGPRRARPRVRRRDPFHAALQSLAAAALPRSRFRPVRGDPPKQGVGRHRRDRAIHGDRDRAQVGSSSSTPTSSSPRPASSFRC